MQLSSDLPDAAQAGSAQPASSIPAPQAANADTSDGDEEGDGALELERVIGTTR